MKVAGGDGRGDGVKQVSLRSEFSVYGFYDQKFI